MSGPSGSGVPPPAGVVCNSALSFVASAQALPTENESAQGNLQEASGEQAQADRAVPAGLKALYDACTLLYPDQPNPLQVTTRLKYWLGGEDPLDYISMYWNPGKPEEHIPPHWHYISFGLSDLHGDGRVHPWSESQSGYGLELSMRVCADGAGPPPLWPAALCQALARYVFTTGNKFCAGDHISWHRPLDGRERGRIRHLLVAADPALPTQHTPHGTVEFLQLVGCTSRELKAAQRGSGFEVLKMMKEDPNAGGPFLVTRPSRVSSCRVSSVHSSAPASLAGVSCCVRWLPLQKNEESSDITAGVEKQIKDTLQRGLTAMSTDSNGKGAAVGHMSTDSFEMSSIERALPQITDTVSSWRDEETVRYFDSVHIFLNAEGASLLPLALDGRIKHDRHFTWRGGDCAVTLLSPRVSGAFATDKEPYAARGGWLQVVVTSEMAALLGLHSRRLRALETPSEPESDSEAPAPALPLSISAKSLNITVTY